MTRDLRNAVNQATRFGIVLERMNANAQRERNRQKRRVAALIVGFLVARMGWTFGWNAINDLMDRAVEADQIEAIHATLAATPGVIGVHELRTRRMGDLIAADVHLEVEATLSVEAGHDIAVEARSRVMQAHPVLSLMIHVDPWRRPDRDHDTGPLSGR